MVDLSTPTQSLCKGRRTKRHNHELLGIGGLPGGMCAAIQDVHHRYRQHVRIYTAYVTVKRQAQTRRSSLGNSQRDAQDGVGAELTFVGCAVQGQEFHINGFLVGGIPAVKLFRDDIINCRNGFQHTLAAIALLIAIPQFKGLMDPG